MINILKHGNFRKGLACDNCGCLFVYTPEEVKTGSHVEYAPVLGRIRKFYKYVECPECKHHCLVNLAPKQLDDESK